MSLYIISGRNEGYPCVPEVQELPEAKLFPPVYGRVMKISPHINEGYPYVGEIKPLPESVSLVYPYPDTVMSVLGEEFNSGYPCIPALENAERKVMSKIVFGERAVRGMYYGGRYIRRAYCKGEEVYKVYWEKIKK